MLFPEKVVITGKSISVLEKLLYTIANLTFTGKSFTK